MKKSYRDLVRENKAIRAALDATINDIVHEMSKLAATNEMLEDVMDQHQRGGITKMEFAQWYRTWIATKNDDTLSAEQIAERLGLEMLPEQFKVLNNEIFNLSRRVYNEHFKNLMSVK